MKQPYDDAAGGLAMYNTDVAASGLGITIKRKRQWMLPNGTVLAMPDCRDAVRLP